MQKSWQPTAAGVLAIVAGAFNLLFALVFSITFSIAAPFSFALMTIGLIGALYLGTGVVAVIGGINALQRRHWGSALAGAICAVMPPATVLGIVSIVFVALSRDEFVSAAQEQAGPVGDMEQPAPGTATAGEGGSSPASSEQIEAERHT